MMKVNFVGDIGLFQRYEDFDIDPFNEVQMPASDINIGNFEFPIPKDRSPFFYDVQDRYSCNYEYFTRMNVGLFEGLGFGNNHAMDYGKHGYNATREYLEKMGVKVFGFSCEDEYTIGSFDHGGVSLGIVACVKGGRWSKENFGFGPDAYDPDRIIGLLARIKKDFDHIVVFPHWGTELIEIPDYTDTVHAKRMVDAGATAVIGHHPHISQGLEQYGDAIIAYSLGSFIYMPEEEVGFNGNTPNREISICLNIEFSKERMISYHAFYYQYNQSKHIPERIAAESIGTYIHFLNNNIYNQSEYRSQVRKRLFWRELRSFWHRFRSKPFKTLRFYIGQLKMSKLNKLIK